MDLVARRPKGAYEDNARQKNERDEKSTDFAGMLNSSSIDEYDRESRGCRQRDTRETRTKEASSSRDGRERDFDVERTESGTSDSTTLRDGNRGKTAGAAETAHDGDRQETDAAGETVHDDTQEEAADAAGTLHGDTQGDAADVASTLHGNTQKETDDPAQTGHGGNQEQTITAGAKTAPTASQTSPQPPSQGSAQERQGGDDASAANPGETAGEIRTAPTTHDREIAEGLDGLTSGATAANDAGTVSPDTARGENEEADLPQQRQPRQPDESNATPETHDIARGDEAPVQSRTSTAPQFTSEADTRPLRAVGQVQQDAPPTLPTVERGATASRMTDSIERLQQIREIVRQLGAREAGGDGGQGRSITMTLYPESLGKLLFSCHADGDRMSMLVRADSEAALAVLNDMQSEVVRLVEQEGFRSVQFDIRPDTDSGRRHAHEQDGQPARKGAAGQIVPSAADEIEALSETPPVQGGTSRRISVMA